MVSSVKRTPHEQRRPWKALVVVILLGSFPGGSKSLLNCDLARSLCAQHEACASVLRIIPRLCGIEKGACSTVTVDKCKAGLKTLQAFPYFRPTCLCREPHLDPKCNEYRTFIFDHPCMYVDKQEFEDLYHVSALPHCDYALDHCQRDEKCSHLIYRFRQACRVRDDQCVMESSDACQEAWSAVRLSPVFGCICPTNASKRMNKCERVFQQIHSNPCIDSVSTDLSRGIAWHSSQQPSPTSSSTDNELATLSRMENAIPSPTTTSWSSLLHGLLHDKRASVETDTFIRCSTMHRLELQDDPSVVLKRFVANLGNFPHSTPEDSIYEVFVRDPYDVIPANSRKLLAFDEEGVVEEGALMRWKREARISWISVVDTENVFTTTTSTTSITNAAPTDEVVQEEVASEEPPAIIERDTDSVESDSDGPVTEPPPDERLVTSAAIHLPRFVSINPCWDISAALKVHGHGFWTGGRANGYRSAVTGVVAPQGVEDPEAFRPSELEDLNPTRKKERDGGADSSSVGAESALTVDSGRTSAESSVLSSSYVGAVGGSDGQVVAVSTGADANQIPGLRSTCHEAERRCRNNEQCHLALQDMESSCDPHHCTPNACRRSIKKFYERIPQDLAEEVAFCVCSEKDPDCGNAMNKMHPPCSLKSHRDITPLCHQVAQDCKTNPHCRPTLESFEQACAVDSDTLRCAGRRGECRSSVIRTLGSQLRVPCSCPPTSMTSPVADVYNCLGWQRLLWLNPCVDEAQDDYLAKRFGLQNLSKPPGVKTVQEVGNPYPKQPPESRPPPSLVSTNNYDPRPSPQGQALDDLDDNADYVDKNEDQAPPLSAPGVLSTSSTTKKPTTSTATTTTTATTSTTTQTPTTAPPRYCELIKGIETYRIMEGSTVRIYNLAKPECSELCDCPMQTAGGYRGGYSSGSNRTPLLGAPKCRALDCVDRQGCYTLSAPYEHGAPAYQAYRGKCLCYSGAFICMKPEKSVYELGEAQGVFIFLGFSRADERILAPLTKKSVLDTIPLLERIIVPDAANKTACRLLLYNSTEENLILQARLMDFSEELLVNGSVPTWFLWRERNECTPALESLKELINRPDPRIRNTPALSMLKLADVEVRMPAMVNTGTSTQYATKILVLAVALSFHLISLVLSTEVNRTFFSAKSAKRESLTAE